ncbi:MAG: hypothetical protein IH600_14415 [Bacteroidetes bacterium]|nr:hypothetical protein [Bacteroidota bacterium]
MKKIRSHSILVAALSVLILAGCGGKNSDTASEEKSALDQLSESAQNMATAAEEASKGFSEDREPVPPVSFKVLLGYLPMQVLEMKQENKRGETSTMSEWTFSQASADYNGTEGISARVEIFDYAYIGMMYAPIRMWLKMKINRESTEGYERTTEVAGFPAYEKFENESQHSEVTLLVGDRFIVTINTNKLPENMPRQVAEEMRLQQLAKESGKTPA